MAVSNVHTLYAVSITSGALLDQVSDWNFGAGLRHALLSGDGSVDPTFVTVGVQEPSISFTTTAIATALAACGLDGLAIASANALVAWLQKCTEGGTRTAGANHIKAVMNKGILVPRSINANQEGATISFDAVATYDGTNAPFVLTGSQSLTGTAAVSEAFVAGPCVINGTTINGVVNITIDFGLQVRAIAGDGHPWPTYCTIIGRQPRITITTPDVTVLTTFGLNGVAQSATDSVIYLRKCDEGGTRVADVTAEHISFSIDQGHIFTNSIRAPQGSEAMAELVIVPTYDGSNAIIAIDTTAAIA